MSISDDLNEIDRILEEANPKPMCTHAGVVSQAECPYCKPAPGPQPVRRLDVVRKVEDRRRREIQVYAGKRPTDFMQEGGFRKFNSIREMMAELRRQVMLKMIRQAHEAELAEPGEAPSSGIVGTPEW